jgi:hypothetical protein
VKPKVDPPDDWKAAAKGGSRALLKLIPGIGVPLAAYEEVERQRKQKALDELHAVLASRIEIVEEKVHPDWLKTDDGQLFASKVVEAALDAQLADKRQLFANALINSVLFENTPIEKKLKFVDLLRGLSRVALDVLAAIHRMCGPTLKSSGAFYISDTDIARTVAGNTGMDPYLVSAAVAELRAAGLFSAVVRWTKDIHGEPQPSGGWLNNGEGYTEFTDEFVRFIIEPE